MRRPFLCLGLVLVCLAAAGCGSSGHPKASGPVADELSYFAPGTPFLAAVQTNSKSTAIQNAEGLLGAFPIGKLAITTLESELLPSNLSYQSDVEPLYGNPITVGVLEVPGRSSLTRSRFLAVWITRSAAKLKTLITAFPGLRAGGSYDGAALYRTGGGATLALDGPTLLFGSSAAGVEAALNRHSHGAGISSSTMTTAMVGLPQHPLIEAFGSLSSLLAAPGAANARKVPWVAAIHSYGATVSATSAGLSVHFRLDTSGTSVSSAELPIAGGTTAPAVAGTLPIAVGLRDPGQSLRFLEAGAQADDPRSYARFAREQNAAKRKTGYDLSTFAALLTGDLIVESNTKTTMARAQVGDRASAARQLAKLPLVAHDIFGGVSSVTRKPGGFYQVTPRHGNAFNLGLVGDEFVAGVATPAQLRAFAAAPASAVPGAQGSLALRISVLELLRLALGKAPAPLVRSVVSMLGDVTGSVTASADALTGQLTLAVR